MHVYGYVKFTDDALGADRHEGWNSLVDCIICYCFVPYKSLSFEDDVHLIWNGKRIKKVEHSL